ncbi:tyrosine-type recombinase/integrase [Anaerocolumna aminovalerica]|uniref:tyrosine-type recombinase/integrase n=1 Tax=Anaerocolumna aminovalerica TaxID=1527 RepID=UPI001C0F2691|nr:tyrosine-type recombinase/integrase [Anaerocolumna aminovalerica]MBU5332079.1 tyrosine-type recombinase/integrase [Anaerocolumna aminovalerica]
MNNLSYINESNKYNYKYNDISNNLYSNETVFIGNKNNVIQFVNKYDNFYILASIPDEDDFDEEDLFVQETKRYEVFPFKTAEDIQKISDYLASAKNTPTKWRNILMFTIGCNIGLRAGDLLQLKWGHIIRDDATIVDSIYVLESKTKRTRNQKKLRRLFFNDECKKAIMFYLEHTYQTLDSVNKEDYIFKSRKKNVTEYIQVRSANKILKEAATAVGIEYNVGTHSMRKTFAYTIYKKTNDIELVQKILGHSNSKVTLRYIGIDDEMIREGYHEIDLNITNYVNEYLNNGVLGEKLTI